MVGFGRVRLLAPQAVLPDVVAEMEESVVLVLAGAVSDWASASILVKVPGIKVFVLFRGLS